MDKRILNKIEYYTLCNMLAEFAVSDMGKDLAYALQPDEDYKIVKIKLEQTAQAETALGVLQKNPVGKFDDLRSILKKASVTIALGQSDLLRISRAMQTIRLCKQSLINQQEIGEHLSALANMLTATKYAEEEIQRCILSEEELSDSASPLLSKLRQQIRKGHSKIKEKLENMLRSTSFSNFLQDPIVTLRNGRYVIPVKQEYKSNVMGILHDQSGSGATLFIEPLVVVEIGNEIRRLQGEEKEEIDRILSRLTQLIAPDAAAISQSLEVLSKIDLIFAKAQLAKSMNATCPELNREKDIRILEARHPLIAKDKVVPIDIWMGKDFKTLIITGPNTGGKTVTLKTVGLFSAMVQSGLFLPASAGVRMPIFKRIFADIGDEQSIEQSLSTFSAHMTNIVNILDNSDDESLVLLDELGSGTDPVEGAALAMAILEELHKRGCMTLATTHYSELKAFAMTREGMENASMEFDVNTLRPTYKLFIGIPGKSNAFEISRKLGLDNALIESAQRYLKGEDLRFEDVISSAQNQRSLALQERKMAQEARQEWQRLQEKTQQEQQKWDAKKDQILKKAREESKKMIEQAKNETELIIKELRKSLAADKNNESDRSRAIQAARDALRNKNLNDSEIQDALNYAGEAPKSVLSGDEVFLIKLAQSAYVISQINDKEAEVQVGIIKLKVKLKDVRLLSKVKKQEKAKSKLPISNHISFELDLRGERVDDALIEFERYLDDARMAGLEEVTIIHGKGTGAIREALHEKMRRDKSIKIFRLGSYGEGDAGVTIVQLN